MNTTETSTHETVIAIAMTIAERNGYPTGAWRLFESEAEAALAKMSSKIANPPPLVPEHHDDPLGDARPAGSRQSTVEFQR